jgi:hypothetical protein
MKHSFCLSIVSLALTLQSAIAWPPMPPRALDPEVAKSYELRKIKGMSVYVERELLDAGDKVVDDALKCLELRIDEVLKLIPPKHLPHFRKLSIWVVWDNSPIFIARGFPCGNSRYILTGPQKTGDPIEDAKKGGIEVPAAYMLLEPKLTEAMHYCPYWLVHEFAHAYHDQVVGGDDSRVEKAYQAAKDRALYHSVENKVRNAEGKIEIVWREAYANTNYFEYFAELSQLYFSSTSSSFPYTRSDLKKYDKAGFGLMEEIWGKIDPK